MGFPSDCPFDVCSSVHIVCSDGFGEVLQGKVCLGQEANVNEVSCGATVNEGSGFNNLCSSSQFDQEMNSSLIWQGYKYMGQIMGRRRRDDFPNQKSSLSGKVVATATSFPSSL